jgi:large subunit ribosomal protein L14e
MFDVGRMCLKIAGRDAGMKCVVVEVIDERYVLIDGMTRRRKCNLLHLEPLEQVLELESNASHGTVIALFKDMGFDVAEKNSKQKSSRISASRKSLEKHKTNVASKDEKKKKLAEKKQKRHEEIKKKVDEKKQKHHEALKQKAEHKAAKKSKK